MSAAVNRCSGEADGVAGRWPALNLAPARHSAGFSFRPEGQM